MVNLTIRSVALSFVVPVMLALPTYADTSEQAVDPAAVEALKRMTDFLSGLQQFGVHTENTLEDQLDSGQRVDFGLAANVIVQRPDKLRAARTGELVSQEFYYDGETLALYDPTNKYYATQPAPDTIEALLDYTREELGMVIPVSDLVYRNVFAILMQGVTSAVVVGKARIGGVTCDHLAFRRPDVDFQIWISEGGKPLPCKYVVTDTSTPELISTVTVMSDWDLAPNAPDAAFKLTPPDGAQAIKFLPLDETSGFGR